MRVCMFVYIYGLISTWFTAALIMDRADVHLPHSHVHFIFTIVSAVDSIIIVEKQNLDLFRLYQGSHVLRESFLIAILSFETDKMSYNFMMSFIFAQNVLRSCQTAMYLVSLESSLKM